MKISTPCLIIGLLALGAQAAHAQEAPQQTVQGVTPAQQVPVQQPFGVVTPRGEVGYIDVLAGLAYADNPLLTSRRGQQDGLGTLGFATNYQRTGMLSVNLLGNVDRLQYVRGTLPGSFYGQFNGSAILGKDTDPVQWRLSDSFGEAMTDPFQAPTPESLQTINDVATGPDFNLHFGLRNRLTLSGLYSRTTYQRSPFDSQSFEGGLKFTHALTGAAYVAFEGSTERTEYLQSTTLQRIERAPVPNFDVREGSVVFGTSSPRTTLLVQVGYNMLDFGGGNTSGAPLYRLQVTRKISPFSTVFLSGESSYSMNGASMGSLTSQIALQTGNSLNAALAIPQPYEERSGSIGWTFQRALTNLSLSGTVTQNLYQHTRDVAAGAVSRNNSVEEGASLIVSQQLRPTVSVQLQANGYIDRYSHLNAATRRETIGLTLSKTFVRLAVYLYADRTQQSGSAGRSNFLVGSYSDDQVGVYFTYSLLGPQTPGASLNGIPGMANFLGGY
jgi:hypothetical protein